MDYYFAKKVKLRYLKNILNCNKSILYKLMLVNRISYVTKF